MTFLCAAARRPAKCAFHLVMSDERPGVFERLPHLGAKPLVVRRSTGSDWEWRQAGQKSPQAAVAPRHYKAGICDP